MPRKTNRKASPKGAQLTQASVWKGLKATRTLTVIAGPCVIEGRDLCLKIADRLARTCRALGIQYVFKASYDKANRTSVRSFRGPGLHEGLEVLQAVRSEVGVPVLTDVHSEAEASSAGEVVDILQIPAFLCRQTDLIAAAVETGRIVNIKKGQFLSPQEMGKVLEKAATLGGRRLAATERGTTFGYNNLVSDMRSIPIMRRFGYPVIFDATHSVQLPGGAGDESGGQREFVPLLAQCGVVSGANGIFMETHPSPDTAQSDGPNMVPTQEMAGLLKRLVALHRVSPSKAIHGSKHDTQ